MDKKYLNITTEEKNKKDLEKLFKLVDEIENQEEIINKAKMKINNIKDKYGIGKLSLTEANDELLIKVNKAINKLK